MANIFKKGVRKYRKFLGKVSEIPGGGTLAITLSGGAALLDKKIRKGAIRDWKIGAAVGTAIAGGGALSGLASSASKLGGKKAESSPTQIAETSQPMTKQQDMTPLLLIGAAIVVIMIATK